MLNITEQTVQQFKTTIAPCQESLEKRPWIYNNLMQMPFSQYMTYVLSEAKVYKKHKTGYIIWPFLPMFRDDIMDKYKDNFISMMLPENNTPASYLFKISKDHSFYIAFFFFHWEKNNSYYLGSSIATVDANKIIEFKNENKDYIVDVGMFGERKAGFGF
jgi:hypothetical protein